MMKHVVASVAAIALAGAMSASAEEKDQEQLSGAGDGSDTRFTWDSEAAEKSLLLPQFSAVLRARDARLGVTVETTQVRLADNATASGDLGNCKHMPRPGSRFMTTRCFYPSTGERTLNDYQFRAEIEQMREQHARDFLEVAEYSLAYRRHLLNGGE